MTDDPSKGGDINTYSVNSTFKLNTAHIYFTSPIQKVHRTNRLRVQMLQFCGLTWWKKLKYLDETTDLGQATTTRKSQPWHTVEMIEKSLPFTFPPTLRRGGVGCYKSLEHYALINSFPQGGVRWDYPGN